MSKSKPPEPETREAWLQSYGYGPGAPIFTLHKYTRTVDCHLGEDGEAWEYLFKCTKTGVERRWGIWFDNADEEESN